MTWTRARSSNEYENRSYRSHAATEVRTWSCECRQGSVLCELRVTGSGPRVRDRVSRGNCLSLGFSAKQAKRWFPTVPTRYVGERWLRRESATVCVEINCSASQGRLQYHRRVYRAEDSSRGVESEATVLEKAETGHAKLTKRQQSPT